MIAVLGSLAEVVYPSMSAKTYVEKVGGLASGACVPYFGGRSDIWGKRTHVICAKCINLTE
jgi:hypothetical protein